MLPFASAMMMGGGAGPIGPIDLNFASGSYGSGGSSYGSFAAYLIGTGSTFSRASTATYFDNAGVLQTAAANAPRFNYDPGNSNTFRGLLIEPERQNIIPYSEDQTQWSPANTTVSANSANGPDGNATADKVAESAGSNLYHQLVRSASSPLGLINICYSIFVKAAERSRFALLISNDSSSNWLFYQFDIGAGTVGSPQFAGTGWTAVGAGIENVGGGIYRCYITGVYSGSGQPVRAWIETNDASGNRQYTGTAGSGLYFWGAQVEGASTRPTTYYANPSTTLNIRSADTFSIALPGGSHDITFTFDDNSTQVITGISGTYAVPTSLNRPNIKRITST